MTGWRLDSVGKDETDYLDSAAENDDVLGPKIEPIGGGTTSQEYVRRKRQHRNRITPILILIAVVLLFAVSAWYVYQRFGGSSSAEVPVIRADTSPISRAPDDPGGLVIPNQDRVVLERGEVDETVLAGGVETDNGTVPITDLPLNIDNSSDVADLSIEETAEEAAETAATVLDDAEAAVDETVEEVTDTVAAAAEDATEAVAEIAEVADGDGPTVLIERLDEEPIVEEPAVAETGLGDEVEQLAEEAAAAVASPETESTEVAEAAVEEDAGTDLLAEATEAAEETVADAASAPAEESEPADVADVIEEVLEPAETDAGARIVEVPQESAEQAPATEQVAEVIEEVAPPVVEPTVAANQAGGFRVQVSSVQSEAAAREFWSELNSAHPDLLGALDLTIEQATVNGQLYNRVQAGPLDEAGAAALCDGLKARGQDCILVRR